MSRKPMSHQWITDFDSSLTVKDAIEARWAEPWLLIHNIPTAWYGMITITFPHVLDPRDYTWHLPPERAKHAPLAACVQESPLDTLIRQEAPVCSRCLRDAFIHPLGLESASLIHGIYEYFQIASLAVTWDPRVSVV